MVLVDPTELRWTPRARHGGRHKRLRDPAWWPSQAQASLPHNSGLTSYWYRGLTDQRHLGGLRRPLPEVRAATDAGRSMSDQARLLPATQASPSAGMPTTRFTSSAEHAGSGRWRLRVEALPEHAAMASPTTCVLLTTTLAGGAERTLKKRWKDA
jgi:hypothetical protein